MQQTIHALVHCDGNTGSGPGYNTARLTSEEATRAGANLARQIWHIYTDGEDEPFPAHLVDDYDVMASLRDFEDVTIEVEEVAVPEDVAAALARGLLTDPEAADRFFNTLPADVLNDIMSSIHRATDARWVQQ